MAAGGCALNGACRDAAIASAGRTVAAVARDPSLVVRAGESLVGTATKALGDTADRVGTAWRTGNFRELGKVTAEIGSTFVPVAGLVAKGGALVRATAGGARLIDGLADARRFASSLDRLLPERVGSGARLRSSPMIHVRDIARGERLRGSNGLLEEVSSRTWDSGGLEHAIVRMNSGTRAIVKGGPGGIKLPRTVARVIVHSHPTLTGVAKPSVDDVLALRRLGQASSHILQAGRVQKYWRWGKTAL